MEDLKKLKNILIIQFMKYIKIITTLCFFFFFGQIYSQNQNSISEFQKKYSASNLVRTIKEQIVNIELIDDEIVISQSSIEESIYLNESAKQYSEESVSYSSFFELDEIEASSFSFANGKYVKNKVSEFREKDEINNAFFDDLKSLNFIYPKLDKGSKTRLALSQNIKNSRFLPAFYFGGYYPILNSKFSIIVDNEIEIEIKEFNTENVVIDFTKVEKRNKVIYTWKTTNVDRIRIEEGTPNFKNYYPHIIPIITRYESKKKGIVELASKPSHLYNWYYSLVKNINKDPVHLELKGLVEKLIENKKTELEKVRAIYYWVQNNIKYIAFEYALGGFIPRDANDVYLNKYGDCKDNSSILYEMLKIAGLKGYLTWVGTREIPYSYEELPTPAVDNHMILTFYYEGKNYFLDATGRYIPLEFPTSFIQGKEALVGKGPEEFEIIKVPIINENDNEINTYSITKIEGDNIVGKASKLYRGYDKITLFNELDSKNTIKKLKDYYREVLQLGNNKFTLKDFKEENKFEYDKDFKISYDFDVSNYVIKDTDDIYINMNLDKRFKNYRIDDNRKTDIEIDYKKTYNFINELFIPKGFIVDYLPENLSIENDKILVSISYKLDEDKVIYSHKISFKFLVLTTEDQIEYNNIMKQVNKAYKDIIILKRIK
tara:strand:- start:38671 stop:40650 length:1980 start_codon:yes stop_codon:yes gene_type:complete